MIPILLSSRRFATRRNLLDVVLAYDNTLEIIQDPILIQYITEMNENNRNYNTIKARMYFNHISKIEASFSIQNIHTEYRNIIANITRYLVTTYPNYHFNMRDAECFRIEYIPREILATMTIQYINGDEIIVPEIL